MNIPVQSDAGPENIFHTLGVYESQDGHKTRIEFLPRRENTEQQMPSADNLSSS